MSLTGSCAQDVPDHCTIARFRPDCQDAFTSLFRQVLLIAAQAGLGNFGTVAIDGTKICANASIDANRGGDWLAEQMSAMVAEAEHADAAEAHGREPVDGDRVPAGPGQRGGRCSGSGKQLSKSARICGANSRSRTRRRPRPRHAGISLKRANQSAGGSRAARIGWPSSGSSSARDRDAPGQTRSAGRADRGREEANARWPSLASRCATRRSSMLPN